MANPESTVFVKIKYPINNPENIEVEHNLKTDELAKEEVLSNYLHNQMGRGEDKNPPADLDVYEITIGIDLADEDRMYVNSNTGNAGLTAGLVMDTIKRYFT